MTTVYGHGLGVATEEEAPLHLQTMAAPSDVRVDVASISYTLTEEYI